MAAWWINCRQWGGVWLRRACVGLPIVMLALHLFSWQRWGSDFPFVDDWLPYIMGDATSLMSGRLWLSYSGTIGPVGLALDILALRWMGGNALLYQSVSLLLVLGGLLWLQWKLLGWALRRRQWQALAFALTFFMLQPGTYWGEQSLAYHQALPLLALLGAVWLAFADSRRHRLDRLLPSWRMAVMGVLGILAGLSYISGALAALVMGGAWCLLAIWLRDGKVLRRRALQCGWPLALAGMCTLGVQIWITFQSKKVMPWTLPNDLAFWSFYAGLFGRATGKAFPVLGWELLWLLAWVLAMLALAVWALVRMAGTGHAGVRRAGVVMLSLLAVLLAYMGQVSFGRAGARADELLGMADMFRLAYVRFHFFWVTLLFPWLAAVAVWWLRRYAVAGLVAVILLLVLAGSVRGIFGINSYYRSAGDLRAEIQRCVMRHLGSAGSVAKHCPGFELVRLYDINRVHTYAQDIGATFVRHLPLVEREGFGRTLLYAKPEHGRWIQAQPLSDGWWQGDGDMQWHLRLMQQAEKCHTLGVRLEFEARQAGQLQVFYQSVRQDGFSERHSAVKAYDPAQAHQPGPAHAPLVHEFVFTQPAGFGPELRVDIAQGLAQFRVHSLRVACMKMR